MMCELYLCCMIKIVTFVSMRTFVKYLCLFIHFITPRYAVTPCEPFSTIPCRTNIQIYTYTYTHTYIYTCVNTSAQVGCQENSHVYMYTSTKPVLVSTTRLPAHATTENSTLCDFGIHVLHSIKNCKKFAIITSSSLSTAQGAIFFAIYD